MRNSKDEEDGAETPLLENDDNVVTIFNHSDSDSPSTRSARRSRSTTDRIRGRNSALLGAKRTPSNLFKSSSTLDPQNESSDVAFTIIVNRQGDDDDEAGQTEDAAEDNDRDNNRVEVDFVQEAVQEAIQEAVQDAVQEVVQDTVTEAIQEAVAAAFEENGRFDVRANFYTLIAITGVVLYWRGVWNSWDYCFGLSIWSEGTSVVTGLIVMIAMRYLQVPLVESLPGG